MTLAMSGLGAGWNVIQEITILLIKLGVKQSQFLSGLSYSSTDAGTLKEEAVNTYCIVNGSALMQSASVTNLDKANGAEILKVITEVLLGFNSSDTFNWQRLF